MRLFVTLRDKVTDGSTMGQRGIVGAEGCGGVACQRK